MVTFSTPKYTTIPADKTNYYPTRLKSIRVIVLHDMEITEGASAAEVCARLFQRPHFGGSTHVSVDTDSIVRSVPDTGTAFGAPNVNADGLHIEQAGFASQTATQWKDTASLQIMENAAIIAATWAITYKIPLVWLSDTQIRDGKTRGFLTHRDASRAFATPGGHTDPGPNYPRGYFMSRVAYHYNLLTRKDWLAMATQGEVEAAFRNVLKDRTIWEFGGTIMLTGVDAVIDPVAGTTPPRRVTISNLIERIAVKVGITKE